MTFLRLLPIILSALALGAHFHRAGALPFAMLSLIVPFLLLIKRKWVARFTQLFLILGALEWLKTLMLFVNERRILGLPWGRLVVILGIVTIFTGASALLFSRNRALMERYRITTLD